MVDKNINNSREQNEYIPSTTGNSYYITLLTSIIQTQHGRHGPVRIFRIPSFKDFRLFSGLLVLCMKLNEPHVCV